MRMWEIKEKDRRSLSETNSSDNNEQEVYEDDYETGYHEGYCDAMRKFRRSHR